jgi:hypothetical protein
MVLVVAQLAIEYGFSDIDGSILARSRSRRCRAQPAERKICIETGSFRPTKTPAVFAVPQSIVGIVREYGAVSH